MDLKFVYHWKYVNIHYAQVLYSMSIMYIYDCTVHKVQLPSFFGLKMSFPCSPENYLADPSFKCTFHSLGNLGANLRD